MSIEPIEPEPHGGRRLLAFRGKDPDAVPAPDQTTSEPITSTEAPAPAASSGSKLASVMGVVVGISLALVIVAPVTLSATHLVKWASSPTGLGLPIQLAWLVFVALDLAAVTCIGMVVLCAQRGEGAGPFSLATWGFAFGSAAANYSGGHGAGKWFFPAMSLAGPALLEMVLSKVKRWARIANETQLSARPKFGVRWIPGIAFGETARAWAAARRENIPKASDAIAHVREVKVLATMNDEDAVSYAATALKTADPYELRRWLTARGKDVSQAVLSTPPAIARPAMTVQRADDDLAREDAPMSETFAPMPPSARAPRKAMGLPPAPESTQLPAPKPAARPKAKPVPVRDAPKRSVKGDPTSHPKWGMGVAAYRKSVTEGNPMSQRELAEFLQMSNRTLASKVQAHVSTEMGREG